jgi:drug/metabolite transporter (DMT)-like permease
MWFLLALMSAITFGLASYFMKYSSYKKWSLHYLLLGMYMSGTISFLITAFAQEEIRVNGVILVAGLVIGIGSTFGNLLFMKALDYGPVSLTSPLVNANIVFVVLLSVFLYGEQLSWLECAAIGLMIVATCLLPFDPNEIMAIHNIVWYLYVLLATILFFFRNGGLKVTEELSHNNTMILMFAYLFGVLWSTWSIFSKKASTFSSSARKFGLYWGFFVGIFSFRVCIFIL